MTPGNDASGVYSALGIRTIINATGTTTLYGGTKTRPEVIDEMARSARVMVNLDDLNRAAGKIIAEVTGAEAGLVTNGAAAGLVLQAAACLAGSDPVKMAQLPDTKRYEERVHHPEVPQVPVRPGIPGGGGKAGGDRGWAKVCSVATGGRRLRRTRRRWPIFTQTSCPSGRYPWSRSAR